MNGALYYKYSQLYYKNVKNSFGTQEFCTKTYNIILLFYIYVFKDKY